MVKRHVAADKEVIQRSWAERDAARREQHVKPPYRPPGTYPIHTLVFELTKLLSREGVHYHMSDSNAAGTMHAAAVLLLSMGVRPTLPDGDKSAVAVKIRALVEQAAPPG